METQVNLNQYNGFYNSTYDFVNRNSLQVEAENFFGENWEPEDDVNQILSLLQHLRCDFYEVDLIEGKDEDDIQVEFNFYKFKYTQSLLTIAELTDKLERSVTWSVEDFRDIAKSREADFGYKYDEGKFEEALYKMIDNHDATEGINWETIAVYLDDFCQVN